MLIVKSVEDLEYRGKTTGVSKNGKPYTLINCECYGEPIQFYTNKADFIDPDITRGDQVIATFEYNARWREFHLASLVKA